MRSDGLEDFGSWEISARLDGTQRLAGLYHGTSAEDAVIRFAVQLRLRFDPSPHEWLRWRLECRLLDASVIRIVTFGRLGANGPLLRLGDSCDVAAEPVFAEA